MIKWLFKFLYTRPRSISELTKREGLWNVQIFADSEHWDRLFKDMDHELVELHRGIDRALKGDEK